MIRWWTSLTRPLRQVLRGSGKAAELPSSGCLENFLRLLARAEDSDQAVTGDIEDGLFVLIIPPAAEDPSDERHFESIDRCLERLAAGPNDIGSLTWSTLVEAQPRFEPSFQQWAGPYRDLLNQPIGIVFFIDLPRVARRVVDQICARGYATEPLSDAGVVRVHADRFCIDIGLDALIAESLWTMRGLDVIAAERARIVPLELAAYRELGETMLQRYPDLDLRTCVDDPLQWQVGSPELSGAARVPYRLLVRQARMSGLNAPAFLARCRLSDLVDTRPVQRKIKAPGFLAAYPDTFHQRRGPFVEVLARDDGNCTDYVRRHDNDPEDRLQHLQLLEQLSLNELQFSGYVFRVEVGGAYTLGVVGEQAVSLIAQPGLLCGVLQSIGWSWQQVRVRAQHEHAILLADIEVVDEALDVILESLQLLADDLFQDRGDRLNLDLSLVLPEEPMGRFELHEVPGAFFELRERAEMAEMASNPGREAYFRGLCFEIVGRSEQAADCFMRALRYDRDNGELNLLLGRCLNDLEQHARAAGFLERAVHALPEDADAANSLGVAYQSVGDQGQALRAFERAAALSPEDPAILVNLGRAYFESDRLDMARRMLLEALERDASLFEAHASLAMLHLQVGDADKALAHAQVALSSRPDDEAMRELVSQIIEGKTA